MAGDLVRGAGGRKRGRCFCKPRVAEGRQGLPATTEARGDEGGPSAGDSGRCLALPAAWFPAPTSGSGGKDLCCSEPPSWWPLVTAAQGAHARGRRRAEEAEAAAATPHASWQATGRGSEAGGGAPGSRLSLSCLTRKLKNKCDMKHLAVLRGKHCFS